MKGLFKYTKTDKIVRLGIVTAGLLVLIEAIFTIVFYFSLPPFLPLFNQLPWGEERLGTKVEIFIPVLITFFFLIFNLLLLNRFYERMPLLSRILSITTLLITLLSFIFILQTLRIIL